MNFAKFSLGAFALTAMLVDGIDECDWSRWQGYNGTAHRGVCSTQVVLGRIPFADLKVLVETPLAEEDANQFIDVDVRPTKSTY